MPVRKVSNRGKNIIGKFPSIKMRRMIAFESLIERDFLYLIDYDKEVDWFEEQPLTIEYQYDGEIRHYTPDFHIIEKGREVLIECKPEKFVLSAENQRKAFIARDWCACRGWEYRMVSDREIRKGERLANIKLLARYAREVVSPCIQEFIYELLSGGAEMSIADITAMISPKDPSLVVGSILHLAFHHKICVPLEDVAISTKTLVRLPLKPRKEEKI